jgi:hypothetical protein
VAFLALPLAVPATGGTIPGRLSVMVLEAETWGPRNVPGTPWFPHIREGLQMTMRRTLVAVAILAVVVMAYVFINMHKENQRLEHLLCETDYQALLKACRELSQRVAAGGLEPKTYVLRYGWPRIVWHPRRDPETKSFPKAVLDLDPVLVQIDRDGRVWVALHVTLPDEGVLAYPENYQAHGGSLGKVELIPGLWFWDDQYQPGVPGVASYVDRLIRKGKEFQQSLGKEEGTP